MGMRGVTGVLTWLVMALWATAGGSAAGQFGGFGDVPQVEVSAVASVAEVAPGGQVAIAVVMDHGETLHSWPAVSDPEILPPEIAAFAIRAEVVLGDVPGVSGVGEVQWPEPKLAMVPNVSGEGPATVEVLTYKGRAIAYVPVLIAEDAAEGELVLPISVSLQACDDEQCYMPQYEDVEVRVTVTSSPANAPANPDFDGFDPRGFVPAEGAGGASSSDDPADAGESETAVASSGVKFLGFIRLPGGDSSMLIWALIGAGLVGGFVLNLTPCVLPVIPIKVMTLTQHAGESRGRAFVLGLWMFVGVVAFWSALALPVLLLEGFADPSQIFGYWWVTAGIGAVIFVMSFGLMGMFNINLPQKAYMVNPKADSPSGSFLFGVMTAVLGLPCFGFIVGALLPAAAASDAGYATAAVFVSMGVGMGLPYLVLSLFPQLVKRVPKTGPASDLVKQVMALLLMGAGAYFIGAGLLALAADMPYIGRVLHWWVVAAFVVAAGLWLVWRTLRISKSVVPTGVFGLVALLLSASGVWVAMNETGSAKSRWITQQELLADMRDGFTTKGWNPYTAEVAALAMASDKVVVMDFTAEWCLNCKALKAAVLDVDPVKSELVGDDVVPITVDLTSRSAAGWERLSDLGQTGIPTLAVFGPGLKDGPWIANAYTSGQVLEAIERARGVDGDSVAVAD
ncbi:MAG: cytochrome c biogenesis protein CcdA [Planctomycetota bacterium]